MAIRYSDADRPSLEQAVELYRTVGWSSAEKPSSLHRALLGSHSVVTAWDGAIRVGLGNAITDGHMVVYFPHMLVRPEYQGHGIGTELMQILMSRYRGFHQQSLLADGRAVDFYGKMGFKRAGLTVPMWIFDGHEHD
jgi:GNAT superfamily N-acetyltransferase